MKRDEENQDYIAAWEVFSRNHPPSTIAPKRKNEEK